MTQAAVRNSYTRWWKSRTGRYYYWPATALKRNFDKVKHGTLTLQP